MDYLLECLALLERADATAAPGSVEQKRVWREKVVVYNPSFTTGIGLSARLARSFRSAGKVFLINIRKSGWL